MRNTSMRLFAFCFFISGLFIFLYPSFFKDNIFRWTGILTLLLGLYKSFDFLLQKKPDSLSALNLSLGSTAVIISLLSIFVPLVSLKSLGFITFFLLLSDSLIILQRVDQRKEFPLVILFLLSFLKVVFVLPLFLKGSLSLMKLFGMILMGEALVIFLFV